MNDDNLTLAELKAKYNHPLFASRSSIGEATGFASAIIEAMPKSERMAAYTAVMVVFNATLDQAARCELKEIA